MTQAVKDSISLWGSLVGILTFLWAVYDGVTRPNGRVRRFLRWAKAGTYDRLRRTPELAARDERIAALEADMAALRASLRGVNTPMPSAADWSNRQALNERMFAQHAAMYPPPPSAAPRGRAATQPQPKLRAPRVDEAANYPADDFDYAAMALPLDDQASAALTGVEPMMDAVTGIGGRVEVLAGIGNSRQATIIQNYGEGSIEVKFDEPLMLPGPFGLISGDHTTDTIMLGSGQYRVI